MNPADIKAFDLAVVLSQSGHKEQANYQIRQLLATYPTDLNLLLWAATTSSSLEEANDLIIKASLIDPANPAVTQAKDWLETERKKQATPVKPVKLRRFQLGEFEKRFMPIIAGNLLLMFSGLFSYIDLASGNYAMSVNGFGTISGNPTLQNLVDTSQPEGGFVIFASLTLLALVVNAFFNRKKGNTQWVLWFGCILLLYQITLFLNSYLQSNELNTTSVTPVNAHVGWGLYQGIFSCILVIIGSFRVWEKFPTLVGSANYLVRQSNRFSFITLFQIISLGFLVMLLLLVLVLLFVFPRQ